MELRDEVETAVVVGGGALTLTPLSPYQYTTYVNMSSQGPGEVIGLLPTSIYGARQVMQDTDARTQADRAVAVPVWLRSRARARDTALTGFDIHGRIGVHGNVEAHELPSPGSGLAVRRPVITLSGVVTSPPSVPKVCRTNRAASPPSGLLRDPPPPRIRGAGGNGLG
jgi:hypothetical protein